MVRKIILILVSLIIPIAGFIIGALYFFRKKQKVWGTIFIVLAILPIVVIAISDSSQSEIIQKSDTSVAVQPTATAEPQPVSVNLREILDLRDANEVAADSKYIGMYVSMKGEVTEIHEGDITILPLDSDAFQMAGAKCSFDKSQSAELIELRKGQTITIEGTIKDIDDFMYNMLDIKPCVFK